MKKMFMLLVMAGVVACAQAVPEFNVTYENETIGTTPGNYAYDVDALPCLGATEMTTANGVTYIVQDGSAVGFSDDQVLRVTTTSASSSNPDKPKLQFYAGTSSAQLALKGDAGQLWAVNMDIMLASGTTRNWSVVLYDEVGGLAAGFYISGDDAGTAEIEGGTIGVYDYTTGSLGWQTYANQWSYDTGFNVGVVVDQENWTQALFVNDVQVSDWLPLLGTSVGIRGVQMTGHKLMDATVYLDNISIGAIPEPATMLLLSLGGVLIRKRK